MNEKKQSGFEPIPEPIKPICRDSEHFPPSHMVIPQGQQYRHVCRSCGAEVVIRPPEYTL